MWHYTLHNVLNFLSTFKYANIIQILFDGPIGRASSIQIESLRSAKCIGGASRIKKNNCLILFFFHGIKRSQTKAIQCHIVHSFIRCCAMCICFYTVYTIEWICWFVLKYSSYVRTVFAVMWFPVLNWMLSWVACVILLCCKMISTHSKIIIILNSNFFPFPINYSSI